MTASARPRLLVNIADTAADQTVGLSVSDAMATNAHSSHQLMIDGLARESPPTDMQTNRTPGSAMRRDPQRSLRMPTKGENTTPQTERTHERGVGKECASQCRSRGAQVRST